MLNKGIWTSTANKYFHSTLAAGINHTPVLVSVDIPLSADNYMFQPSPTLNQGSDTSIGVGETKFAAELARSWIKPDFSSISAGATFSTAVLKLTPTADNSSNARTMRAHRCLVAAVEAQQTWNVYSTGNNWPGSGGASTSGTDYDATEMGNGSIPASPTLNTQMTAVTFTAAELQKLYDGTYTNNGIILFVDTQNNDQIVYTSKENATSAYRPIITIGYYI